MKLGLVTTLAMGLSVVSISATLVVACEGPNMAACAEACAKGLRPMTRWTPNEGCLCGQPGMPDPIDTPKVEPTLATPSATASHD